MMAARDLVMDDGTTALRTRDGSRNGAPGPPPSPMRLRPRVQPHHRRRRAVALTAPLAAIALIAGVLVGAGGGSAVAPHPVLRAGFFTHIRQLAGSGPGSLFAAEQQAEDNAINRTLTYTPYVRIAGSQHREIALTFDDGPGPYTPQVLSVLEREKVPATFFEVGILERYFHASTTRIIGDGDVIGDHTESHAPLSQLPRKLQRAQLLAQTAATGEWGAPFPRLFRPPYGLWNSTTLSLLGSLHMLMVLWTVDTSDYRLPGPRSIIHAALSGARPGAIILMHDGGGDRQETVEALPAIIKGLRARGYRLVTVPRLLLDNPPPANQQISSIVGSGG